jgi:CDP-glycerol glycerophosphotransferase (TagB/SpsB family)
MNILFISDYKAGSNPGAIYDYIKDKYNCVYVSKDYCSILASEWDNIPWDIAITNNGRNLNNVKAKLKVNTHHGNLHLGDSSPEANIDVSLAASYSEKAMMMSNGYRSENVLVTGSARTDRLINSDWFDKEGFLISRHMDPNKLTILYAPTYSRSNFGMGNKYFFATSKSEHDDIDFARSLEKLSGCNIIFRLHGYLRRQYGGKLYPNYLSDYIKDVYCTSHHDEPDSIPYVLASDILITDFSSITADFLGLDKDIFYLNPATNWMYTDKWHCPKEMRDRVGTVIHAEAITDLYLCLWQREHLHARTIIDTVVKDRFCPLYDGQSTQRSWDAILELYKTKYEN